MDINTLLSELVVLADSLDERDLTDVGADLDAAIFIMSSESALPRNKSLAAVVRENYAAMEELDEDLVEGLAVSAAEEITFLTETVLENADSATIVAILTSMAQSLRSVLDPNGALSPEAAKKGSEHLAEAERKLMQHDELKGIGHRVGMVRAKIENG
jgi:threonine dehydratase